MINLILREFDRKPSMFESCIRKKFSRLFTGKNEIALEDKIPSFEDLNRKFPDIDELGV